MSKYKARKAKEDMQKEEENCTAEQARCQNPTFIFCVMLPIYASNNDHLGKQVFAPCTIVDVMHGTQGWNIYSSHS